MANEINLATSYTTGKHNKVYKKGCTSSLFKRKKPFRKKQAK